MNWELREDCGYIDWCERGNLVEIWRLVGIYGIVYMGWSKYSFIFIKGFVLFVLF